MLWPSAFRVQRYVLSVTHAHVAAPLQEAQQVRQQLREAQSELQQRQEHLTREQQRCDDLEAQLLMQVRVEQLQLANIQVSLKYAWWLLAGHCSNVLAGRLLQP